MTLATPPYLDLSHTDTCCLYDPCVASLPRLGLSHTRHLLSVRHTGSPSRALMTLAPPPQSLDLSMTWRTYATMHDPHTTRCPVLYPPLTHLWISFSQDSSSRSQICLGCTIFCMYIMLTTKKWYRKIVRNGIRMQWSCSCNRIIILIQDQL